MIQDTDLIKQPEKYPEIFKKMKKQTDKHSLHFNQSEKDLIKLLIAEVSFVVMFISECTQNNMIDYTHCIEILKQNLLLLEIKAYLVQEFIKVPLDIIKNENFDVEKYEIPENYLIVFNENIKQYLSI